MLRLRSFPPQKKAPPMINPMNHVKKQVHTVLKISLALAGSLVVHLHAQSPLPDKTTVMPDDDEEIFLSPFIVSTEHDDSWFASNTLAASRLNTKLTDVAASLDVFTEDFIQFIGATTLDDLNRYSMNSTDADTLGMPNLDPQNIADQSQRTRGLPTTAGRNYFRWASPTDLYNIDRVEQARGPNGILFGVGSAGGITTSTTKKALTGRQLVNIQLEAGPDDYQRSVLDVNQPLYKKKLALRLNLLKQLSHSPVYHEEADREGVALAVSWRPSPNTTISAGVEALDYFDKRSTRSVPLERTSYWEAKGSNLTAKFPTGTANPFNAADQNNFGITTSGANQQWTFISNSSNLPPIQTRHTGTTLLFSATNPDPVTGRTGNAVATQFPGIEGVNFFGPSGTRSFKMNDYNVSIDQKIVRNMYLSAAYDKFYTDWDAYRTNPPTLQADPNLYYAANVSNPYAGQYYLQNFWFRDLGMRNAERWRISVSYEADLGKWFGLHRLAASYEDSNEVLLSGRYFETYTVNERLFNADPNNANNRMSYRTYVDPYNPQTIAFGARDFSPYSWTDSAGNRYQTYWARSSTAATDNQTYSTSKMLADQAYFWDNRLVVTAGRREERVRFINRSPYVLPTGGFEYVRPPESDYSITEQTLVTNTLGGVLHVKKFSFFANVSSNNGDANQLAILLYPDGRSGEPPQGKGNDLGLMLNLLDDRLTIRATRYETSSVGEHFTGGIQNNVTVINQTIMDVLLDPAGNGDSAFGGSASSDADRLVTLNDYNSRLFMATGSTRDSAAEGYELQIQGRPLPGWNVRLTYAYTDVRRTNVMPEIMAWWLEAKPYFQSFPQTLAIGNATLAQRITTLDNYLINTILIPQEVSTGYRHHNANIVSSYQFNQGRLKGLTVGAGARYKSRNVIAIGSNGENLFGEPIYDLDVFLRYAFTGPRKTRWTLSISGNGVNRSDFKIIPISLNAQNDGVDGVTVLYPAIWKASLQLRF